jgi:hypothetical protein
MESFELGLSMIKGAICTRKTQPFKHKIICSNRHEVEIKPCLHRERSEPTNDFV